ncbi:unnamed protein product [Ceutorhynchus assimilis]|uniref:Spermatogenesis-associated protein 17 n=1 Tax=Ceutorhynchus assimilis TaxID=467358 RepID=A0A9N9MKR2_9CUCU|nr:unnamed protein product [Ceutorhynchus assimilis]
MASVYYLFDDAIHVAEYIVEKYSQQDTNLKVNHCAAIIIQRSYRGYVVRKLHRQKLRAVIILQKYIRGWLVRYHMPDFLQEVYDRKCLNLYNKAATKIQSMWRGVLVRFEIDIKQMMKDKKLLMDKIQGLHISDSLDSQKKRDKEPTIEETDEDEDMVGSGTLFGQNSFLQAQIIKMMFNRHHLLSTEMRRGVLDTTEELKQIEKILKTLPWKSYMNNKRSLYYKYRKYEKCQKPAYHYNFTDPKMRKQEDLNRLRDKSHDLKEEYMDNYVEDTKKPFILHSKVTALPYEQSIMRQGQYTKRNSEITRTEDKSKNISGEDFILTLRDIVRKSKIPPYYVDFWYEECWAHNMVE